MLNREDKIRLIHQYGRGLLVRSFNNEPVDSRPNSSLGERFHPESLSWNTKAHRRLVESQHMRQPKVEQLDANPTASELS